MSQKEINVETDPNYVRCVHAEKPPQWFRKDIADKAWWQRSTGWQPQPVEKVSNGAPMTERKPQGRPKTITNGN
jgi:hypothetical protein